MHDLGFPFHLGYLTGLKILVLCMEVKCQVDKSLHILFLEIIGIILLYTIISNSSTIIFV